MAHRRLRLVCLVGFLLVLNAEAVWSGSRSSALTYAQKPAPRASRVALPSPHSVLGFTPGDDRTIADWRQITDYFSLLDKASDRVSVQTIGQSTLQRPIIAAFISARENLLALDRYREIQRKLADPRTVATDLERDRLINEGKVVVAISCSIHSTEIVASQMSMQLAFELAASQSQEMREILRHTILILIPSPNPDGIDIVANWYRRTLGTNYDGKNPPELYHHYAGHDDNRDWFMLNLKETQAITRLFWKEWFPQIVFDVHQQGTNGSRFFIPPFFDPAYPRIDPLLLRQVGLIGHKIAADLQAAGMKGVITNSNYDTWWHGGFRTAPYFHNSIGILSEAASAKLMSPNAVTREQLAQTNTRGMNNALDATTNFPDPWPGGTWRPRDIMDMEMIAARSVLSMAAMYRSGYLRNFYELGRRNVTATPATNEPIAYLIPAGQAKDEAVARLIRSLIDQGIEVHRLDSELHADYGPQTLQRTNPPSEKLGTFRRVIAHASGMAEAPAGSYIVLLAQPQRQNILALFEPQIYPNRIGARGDAERPYDVTAWTLSMQMGIDAPAVMTIKETPTERKLSLVRAADEVRKDLALPPKPEKFFPVNQRSSLARVGIYKGWTGSMDEGWTRFIFDTFNVPYDSLLDSTMRKGELSSKYDVIVLPSQRAKEIIEGNAAGTYPTEFTGGVTQAGVTNLKIFIEGGGTLICFDASCELPIKQFHLPLHNVLVEVKSSEFYCPGSILSLDVERSHPLAKGLSSTVDAYFINSSAFETTDSSVKIIARYGKDNLLRSGWLLGEDKLRGRIALAEVPLGKGRIILFAFRPQHRGQTWATLPFIWNALAPRSPD